MTHRRLMVPAVAALMVFAAACSNDPPPQEVVPTGPTAEELAAQARADSLAAAQARAEADARAEAAAAAAERAEMERRMAAARSTLESTIYFEYDESAITAASERVLRQKVEILRNSPAVRIQIQGHADERGSNEYNIALGTRRAEAVREFLGGFGIDASRVAIISYGEDRPAVNASTEAAWSQNRRAEFVITAGANQINPGM